MIFVKAYTQEELKSLHIYTSGDHRITVEGTEKLFIVTLGSSHATVETWGSSHATVKTWHSSQATLSAKEGGLIQDRTNRKIFIKKSDYEIVMID